MSNFRLILNCVLLIVLFVQIATSSNTTIINNVIYILNEDINMNQYLACNNHGYAPTSITDTIEWGVDIFDKISIAFGSTSRSSDIVTILKGCCTSSMYCYIDPTIGLLCYTSGFSTSYINPTTSTKSSPSNTSIFNIYTCKEHDSEIDLEILSVEYIDSNSLGTGYRGSFDASGLIVTLSGSNFPKNDKYASAMVQVPSTDTDTSSGTGTGKNSYLCSYLEVCSNLCSICSATHDCPGNAQCVSTVAPWDTGWCFPLCAGPLDLACPCNSKCYSKLFSYSNSNDNQLYSIGLNLCSPNAGFNCNYGLYNSIANTENASIAQCIVLGDKGSNISNTGYVSLVIDDVGDVYSNCNDTIVTDVTVAPLLLLMLLLIPW